MAEIGEPRPSPFGCSAGVARICWRRSIEALSRTQFAPSMVIARPAWVRGLTRLSPLQARRQTRQPQFHCGTPPPAPEPSATALNRWLVGLIVEARRDMNGAAGGRREPGPLHQRTRRGVEIAVAGGAGDRKRGHRAGRADREGDADLAPCAARARALRIEEAAADDAAHLPAIGGTRGGARRSRPARLLLSPPRLERGRPSLRFARAFALGSLRS